MWRDRCPQLGKDRPEFMETERKPRCQPTALFHTPTGNPRARGWDCKLTFSSLRTASPNTAAPKIFIDCWGQKVRSFENV